MEGKAPDPHEVVTLMHDQLDALGQMLTQADFMGSLGPRVDRWIATTRNLLPPRGHRG